MSRRERERGKRGEREWALKLTANGFPARRGVQYQGGPNSPDVVCDCLPMFHFEVKRTQRIKLYQDMHQATDDAGEGKTPIVRHRRDNERGIVSMWEQDWIELVRESSYPRNENA